MKRANNIFLILFLMAILLPTGRILSQDLLKNNETLLFLNNGSTLTLNGSLELEGDSILINNGNLRISGDIEHGDYKSIVGNGSSTFFGNEFQYITGDSNLIFSTLIVDKQNNYLSLLSDIIIKDQLVLNSGILDIVDNNITLLNNATIENENSDHYITGNLGKIIGAENLNFPVNVDIGNIGANISILQNLGLTTIIRTHQPQNLGGGNGIKRCYEIIPLNLNSIPANLSFKYIDEISQLNYLEESDLKTFKLDSILSWLGIFTPVDSMNNVISLFETKALGTYTFGGGGLLPVEFLSFTAEVNQTDKVELDWITATEVNNDYYTIERSSDGLNFSPIEIIKGAGNSTVTLTYETLDEEPLPGLSYYRIKQTDFDGKFKYSVIRAVEINSSSNYEVQLYPNPSKNETIKITGLETNSSFQLFDSSGKEIYKTIIQANTPTDINSLPLKGLTSGVYLYKIINDSGDLIKGNLVKL